MPTLASPSGQANAFYYLQKISHFGGCDSASNNDKINEAEEKNLS
jgi:hypothetical protein